ARRGRPCARRARAVLRHRADTRRRVWPAAAAARRQLSRRAFVMQMVELIRRKRDGGALSDDELREFVQAVTSGEVPDYQTAALLMAIYFKGLDGRELATLTEAMLRSGETVYLSDMTLPRVDKHSTGGVGDKISLALAPAVAACGVAVPMISGRALGHTGGTL